MRCTPEDLYERFAALITDYFRESGWDRPSLTTGAATATAFRATVDGLPLSVGYDPLAGEACVFVYCVAGVAAAADAQTLRRLLERNIAMQQRHGATFCIDAEAAEVVCYARSSPFIEVAQLQSLMSMVASNARTWAHEGDDDGGAEAGLEHATAPPWARLA